MKIKRIICIIKGHSLKVSPSYNWSDEKGKKYKTGIQIACPKCNFLIWFSSKEHVLSMLKDA